MSFQLGAITLPVVAGFDLDQSYEQIGGEAIFRASSGRGIKQATWSKLRITTSGTGWIPSGLEALDYTAQMTLKCIVPKGISAVLATRQATLPTGRRSDSGFIPFGTAILSDGRHVSTPATMAGHVATLDAVAGAVAYQANYYPELTVWAMRPETSGNLSDASYQWQITCEEV